MSTDSEMTDNARSQMGTSMFDSHGSTRTVNHAVELDGFPSQWRGPVLATYCLDEQDNVLVQPRWLTPNGVGVRLGPTLRVADLANGSPQDDLEWFTQNEIDISDWRALALEHAPKETS